MGKKKNKKNYTPIPVTRPEKFLAALAGLFTAPEPITRKEFWMSKTADRILAIEEGSGDTGMEYDLCVDGVGGSVNQIGTLKEGETEYGLYEFYYKATALPTANTAKLYSFSDLLAGYTIYNYVEFSGVVSNGIIISNGRTDNTNTLIFQQASRVSKNVNIRAYNDFSQEIAIIKVIFAGSPA